VIKLKNLFVFSVQYFPTSVSCCDFNAVFLTAARIIVSDKISADAFIFIEKSVLKSEAVLT
jgi:hypothetical protein